VLQTTQQQQFENGIRQVFDAGGGCMTLVILTPDASASIITDAVAGDATANAILTAADQLLRRIHRRSRTRALPCLLCDATMLWRCEPPGAVGVLVPFGVAARVAIGLAICCCCAEDRTETELAHVAVGRLRAGMLPDLRILPPMAVAGHA
jgi:hypothetical protein